ncbi:MAG: hypothetical protein HY594_00725, partial [Candidatus Omnitrophica bacterium]|nr:hypothetical protein [Candidatus Omnitrophota bacterium]
MIAEMAVWAEFVSQAQARFLEAGIERPRWTLDQICSAYFRRLPVDLIADPPKLDARSLQNLRQQIERRCSGVPLQHITGIAGFFGYDFKSTPAALVPRPETERLVEVAIREIQALHPLLLGLTPRAPLVQRYRFRECQVQVGTWHSRKRYR